jgi:hypothetical protein
MKTLIAIMTCQAYRHRADCQRETWVKDIPPSLDYKFFLGQSNEKAPTPLPDEIVLLAGDDYKSFPAKVQAMLRYALENGYDRIFKCDDDVYVDPVRLADAIPVNADYCGRKRGPSGGHPAPYASGFSYWLSSAAAKIIVDSSLTNDPAEDRWVGNTLLRNGICCHADYRYVVTDSRRNAISYNEGPRVGNEIISACEFEPERMRGVHWEHKNKKALVIQRPNFGEHPLSKVCVMVKTFLRDGYLLRTVRSIQENLPESKIVIVDDGYETSFKISWYASLRKAGHATEWLPFDSGFGAKANKALEFCDRRYVLIASDDFEFTSDTRKHVSNMVKALELTPNLDIISGRVNNNPYEAILLDKGDVVEEVAGYSGDGNADGVPFYYCDLTVNFSLIRRELLDKVEWDSDVKIGGGEHGAFYIDVKRAGGRVAYLPNANINEFPRHNTDWKHSDYDKMRARARTPGRICLSRRGVKRYRLMDGSVEITE